MVDLQQPLADEVLALQERVRELEEELRLRDAFIVAAAHELRNPVSPLALHLSRLQGAARAAADDHISARWLDEQLESFSRRLSRFMTALNRILDVSKVHRGSIELIPEDVDLLEIVRDVTASFERELGAARSTLTLESTGPVRGCWDRMRLEQIIYNLVSNAIRYGQSGPITVSVRCEGAHAVLSVKDRGGGIPERDMQRIFERFERLDNRHRGGFGVGLWIVRQLCLAMEGEVAVRARRAGGTAFTVRLPRHADGSSVK